MKMLRNSLRLLGVVAALAVGAAQETPPTNSSNATLLVRGQVLYVPVYSHVFAGTAAGTFNLTATLSLRNTDLDSAITLTSVRYYDSGGALVRTYLEEPQQLAPLASTEVVVEEKDTRRESRSRPR